MDAKRGQRSPRVMKLYNLQANPFDAEIKFTAILISFTS